MQAQSALRIGQAHSHVGDLPAAERALRAFIERFPGDRVVAEGRYWLGESVYCLRCPQAHIGREFRP